MANNNLSKADRLKALFSGQGIIRAMGAHNGLSARLAEKNGFEAIWASGLEVSTAAALPDANILTMTDYLEAASVMNDACDLPVIADCDTGYGNVNNVIRMVQKYEAAGIAAVCIEDKLFPKVNSFVPGRQELAPIAEFVGKIRAAKNAQRTENFMVFARVEALIAGWGQEEAKRRALAYAEAGADAILIHSKSSDSAEILEFIDKWDYPLPLILVPTTYFDMTLDKIKSLNKVKVVIYANHGLRAAITAMDKVMGMIGKSGSTEEAEKIIAPLKVVFDLQGMPAFKEDEKNFGYSGRDPIKTIIPAAGKPTNTDLLRVLEDRPVAMVNVNGKPLLQRQAELLNLNGIQDIRVVTGYGADKIEVDASVTLVKKPDTAAHILKSVLAGLEGVTLKTEERLLVLYSDILFDRDIISRLVQSNGDVTLVIDRAFAARRADHNVDLVQTQFRPQADGRLLSPENTNKIVRIGGDLTPEDATHEFIGIALFSKKAAEALLDIARKAPANADLTAALQGLIDAGFEVDAVEVERGWSEVQTMADLQRVSDQLAGREVSA